MKKKLVQNYHIVLLSGAFLSMLLSGCLKKTDVELKPSTSLSFEGKDLVKLLQEESSLQLFNQAFTRLSLPATITNQQGFTIFALTDSAMKAAGLDAPAINSLPIDSLRKLITNQISPGAYDDNALSNSVTSNQVKTLKNRVVTAPNGGQSIVYSSVYVKVQDGFYFNGVRVNKNGPAIRASNGYLYKVGALMPDLPSKTTLYDMISADPELSMYKAAIAIADSVRFAANGYDDGSGIVQLFSTLPDMYHSGMMPTVLAPTNKAFHNAGLNNQDDLRNLATKYYAGPDFDNYFVFHYPALDSVLQHHVIFNVKIAQSSLTTVRVFYNDLMTTAINNNVYNNFKSFFGDPTYLTFKVPLIFSTTGSTVYVKWTNDPAAAAVALPHDASPGQPVNNFIAANGALYKIDKLFYPAVK